MKLDDYYLNYSSFLGHVKEGNSAFIYNKSIESEISNMTFLEYIIFCSTGIDITNENKEIKEMLEFVMKITPYTDIRIWPNRMTALSGNFQNSLSSGIISGTSSFDSNFFGGKSSLKIYDMIENLKETNNFYNSVIKQRPLYGFSRPNGAPDERRNFFVNKFGLKEILKYEEFQLIFKAEEILFKEKNVKLNISSIFTVLLRKLNFKKNDISAFAAILFTSTLPLIYIHNRENIKNGSFLPIKSEDIIYEGDYKIGRKWEDD
jgi:hypothetical protein